MAMLYNLCKSLLSVLHCCQVRGPIVLSSYHKVGKSAVDAAGWFDTGDVATIDKHGLMRIADRCAIFQSFSLVP